MNLDPDYFAKPGDECGFTWTTRWSRLKRHTHHCDRPFGHDANPPSMHYCRKCVAVRITDEDIAAVARKAYNLRDKRDR